MDIHVTNDFSIAHRNFVVPQDPQDREALLSIDRRCKSDIRYRFGITFDYDWCGNTAANSTLETIIYWVGTNMVGSKSAFNFYNLFSIFATVKTNEDAEKEGNINIVFEPGSAALDLISTTAADNEERPENKFISPAAFFTIDDRPDLTDAYNKIDRLARYALSQKYQLTFPDNANFTAFACLYGFIENVFKYLLHVLGHDPELPMASVNFNDNIEFHAVREDDGIVFYLRPGMNAKLSIKSDEITEDELSAD